MAHHRQNLSTGDGAVTGRRHTGRRVKGTWWSGSLVLATALLFGAPAAPFLGGPSAAAAQVRYDGDLPEYRGPPPPGSTPADISAHVAYASDALRRAFDAMRQGDGRTGQSLLDDAEEVLADGLLANPYSRDAAMELGVVYYYQAYYGDLGDLPRAIEFLTRILEVDPYAEDAARYLAHAYAQLGDGRNTRYYGDYVKAVSTRPELHQEMDELTRPFVEAFLGGWYEYGDYYETGDTRVVEFNPKTFQAQTILEVTPEFEVQMGRQSLAALTQGEIASQDGQAEAYLQQLVDLLVMSTPLGPPYATTVELIESPVPNALAMPGKIVMYGGLITMAENEAELVSVLAHELGHVYAHHSARRLVADVRTRSIAGSVLSMVNVENDLYRMLIDKGAEVGINLILKGYSRSQESEADRLATHLAYNAGYNPTFQTSLFVRLYERFPDYGFRLTQTHPPTTERIENTSAYLENFPLNREMKIDSRAFQEVKRRLGG